MREIKFRAWDKFNDFMWYQKDSAGLFLSNMEELEKGGNGIELMQFTGLRDKNGKEIFEGDLVAEISKVEDLEKWGKPLIVEFGEYSDGEDSWGLNYGTTGFLLRYEDNSVTGIHSKTDKHYGFNCNELMVIGNIHQNPELLQS